jgi:hypothetical protein
VPLVFRAQAAAERVVVGIPLVSSSGEIARSVQVLEVLHGQTVVRAAAANPPLGNMAWELSGIAEVR